jgi:hypothetical protein
MLYGLLEDHSTGQDLSNLIEQDPMFSWRPTGYFF